MTIYCISADSKTSSSIDDANEDLNNAVVVLVNSSYINYTGTINEDNLNILHRHFHVYDDLSDMQLLELN